MSRQEDNRKIVKELSNAIEKYPNLRFHQLLYNLNVQVPVPILNEHGHQEGMHFKDLYSEESSTTVDRMIKDF